MQTISGKEVSSQFREKIRLEVSELNKKGIYPCLAVILVGDDAASQVYVRNKKKACAEAGIRSLEDHLVTETSQNELETLVNNLNQDQQVNGILCQFPLPKGLDEERIIQSIEPMKDVDGLHPVSAGLLAMGKPRFVSCTPFGCLQLLKAYDVETSGKHVVVIGRSNLVGRPISNLLSLKGTDATVTLCHSRTQNLAELTRQADIIVAAIGRPRFVTAEMVKDGAVVLDVGINRVDAPSTKRGYRLVGDVDFDAVKQKCAAITPVPGGVGPMTIAMLLYNTVNASRLQNGLAPLDW